MEKQPVATLGPQQERPTAVATLSRARRGLFELLAEQDGPSTLAGLVELSGLHENTVRAHLEGLAEEGLVVREREAPHGRGRPAWLWRVRAAPADEYAGLAAALARTLRRTSAQPEDDAIEAGHDWGRELARQHRSRSGGTTPAMRTRALLERLGFAPDSAEEPEGAEGAGESVLLRLTRCPLLAVAREEPAIVCNVHVGLTVGAMSEYGATDPDAQLTPFAVPGACLLRLSDASR